MAKCKVLVIGGGFGGLNVVKALKKADAEILLLDRTNHHLFQPLLYQVATSALSPNNIASPPYEMYLKTKKTPIFFSSMSVA